MAQLANPTKRIKKTHVGRPMDFLGSDGVIYNGSVVSIKNGYAELRYYIPGHGDGWKALVRVGEKRVEVY